MEAYKKTFSNLQNDMIKVMRYLSKLLMSNSRSANVIGRQMDEYQCELENLCVRSRNAVESYRPYGSLKSGNEVNENVGNLCGNVEVTETGWLHITLNTLLPNCKYRISNYIGDTIGRLIQNCGYELPYFEKAFMAIVEYCNYENHNALDNDNKGWKMIPNALKGSVIEDDSQFVLSVGLFAEISEDLRCEIYVMPPEDGSLFMELLSSGTI